MILGVVASAITKYLGDIGFPPALVAEAVKFDAVNDYLQKTSTPANLSDSKQITFSGWIYPTDTSLGGVMPIITFADAVAFESSFVLGWHQNNKQFSLYQNRGDNTYVINTQTPIGGIQPFSWYHILFSCDLSTGTIQCYVDDVAQTMTVNDNDNEVIDLTSHDKYAIGAFTTGVNNFKGDLSEIWFDDRYIDLSIENNRRDFITIDGKPADKDWSSNLPCINYKGVAATWNAGTNSGNGGNFTMNGAVTDSINEPVEVGGDGNELQFVSMLLTHSGTTNITSHVIDMPADIQDGDLLVMIALMDGPSRTYTDHTGWTNVADNTADPYTYLRQNTTIFTRTASSEPASYTFTINAAERLSATTYCFRNGVLLTGSPLGYTNNAGVGNSWFHPDKVLNGHEAAASGDYGENVVCTQDTVSTLTCKPSYLLFGSLADGAQSIIEPIALTVDEGPASSIVPNSVTQTAYDDGNGQSQAGVTQVNWLLDFTNVVEGVTTDLYVEFEFFGANGLTHTTNPAIWIEQA